MNLASSDVTGITPVANGGTGTSSPALGGRNERHDYRLYGQIRRLTHRAAAVEAWDRGRPKWNRLFQCLDYGHQSDTSIQWAICLGLQRNGRSVVPPTATLVGFPGGTIAGGSTSYITATADNSNG